MRTVRIRGVQSLGAPAAQVGGVARVALNLRGVSTRELGRGMALIQPGRWTRDQRDRRPPGASLPRSGEPRGAARLPSRLTLHIGAARAVARVRMLGSRFARLTLDHPLPLHVGDRVLLRDPGAAPDRAGGTAGVRRDRARRLAAAAARQRRRRGRGAGTGLLAGDTCGAGPAAPAPAAAGQPGRGHGPERPAAAGRRRLAGRPGALAAAAAAAGRGGCRARGARPAGARPRGRCGPGRTGPARTATWSRPWQPGRAQRPRRHGSRQSADICAAPTVANGTSRKTPVVPSGRGSGADGTDGRAAPERRHAGLGDDLVPGQRPAGGGSAQARRAAPSGAGSQCGPGGARRPGGRAVQRPRRGAAAGAGDRRTGGRGGGARWPAAPPARQHIAGTRRARSGRRGSWPACRSRSPHPRRDRRWARRGGSRSRCWNGWTGRESPGGWPTIAGPCVSRRAHRCRTENDEHAGRLDQLGVRRTGP